jgi:hypothetical protein
MFEHGPGQAAQAYSWGQVVPLLRLHRERAFLMAVLLQQMAVLQRGVPNRLDSMYSN